MEKKELEKLNIGDTLYTTRLSDQFRNRKSYSPDLPGSVISFIPGTIVEILAPEGTVVNIGDDLIILEAMKMKNKIKCQIAGTVKVVRVKPGERVTRGTLLMEIE